jgi:hypothetical protein
MSYPIRNDNFLRFISDTQIIDENNLRTQAELALDINNIDTITLNNSIGSNFNGLNLIDSFEFNIMSREEIIRASRMPIGTSIRSSIGITESCDKYLSDISNEKTDLDITCAICLDAESNFNEKKFSLSCSHVFHSKCISQWFKCKLSCPCCRVVPQPNQNSQNIQVENIQVEDIQAGNVQAGNVQAGNVQAVNNDQTNLFDSQQHISVPHISVSNLSENLLSDILSGPISDNILELLGFNNQTTRPVDVIGPSINIEPPRPIYMTANILDTMGINMGINMGIQRGRSARRMEYIRNLTRNTWSRFDEIHQGNTSNDFNTDELDSI